MLMFISSRFPPGISLRVTLGHFVSMVTQDIYLVISSEFSLMIPPRKHTKISPSSPLKMLPGIIPKISSWIPPEITPGILPGIFTGVSQLTNSSRISWRNSPRVTTRKIAT